MNQEISTCTVLTPFSEMFLSPFLLQVVPFAPDNLPAGDNPFAGKVFAALPLYYRLVARIH